MDGNGKFARSVTILLMFALAVRPVACSAGKLSAARNESRDEKEDKEERRSRGGGSAAPAASSSPSRPSRSSSGKLAQVRREVRPVAVPRRAAHRRHQAPARRPHGHRHRPGPAVSFGYWSPCYWPGYYPSYDVTYVYGSSPAPVAVAPAPVVEPVVPAAQVPPPVTDSSQSWWPHPAQDWNVLAGFELASDFDGLDRRSFELELRGDIVGIDFQWDSFTEDLGPYGHDELHLGDFNVLFALAETEHSYWRAGVGFDWLGDSVGAEFGANLTMKADVFPVRPWVLSGELDLGTLGEAEMLHGSATLGAMLGCFELYSGYDYRKIGAAELDGLSFGLRGRF